MVQFGHQHEKGLSLLELMIYIGIASAVAATLLTLFNLLVRSWAEQQANSAVGQNSRFIQNRLTERINYNTCSIVGDGATLILGVRSGGTCTTPDDTCFRVNANALEIDEVGETPGSNNCDWTGAAALTSSNVVVENCAAAEWSGVYFKRIDQNKDDGAGPYNDRGDAVRYCFRVRYNVVRGTAADTSQEITSTVILR